MRHEMGQIDYKRELFALSVRLVPEWGEADTVQGEMVRAVGRLALVCSVGEDHQWTTKAEFRRLSVYLYRHLRKGCVFNPDTMSQIRQDVEEIRAPAQAPGRGGRRSRELGGTDALSRLMDRVVDWCRHHPQLIPRQVTPVPSM